jgi:hypothetical protein
MRLGIAEYWVWVRSIIRRIAAIIADHHQDASDQVPIHRAALKPSPCQGEGGAKHQVRVAVQRGFPFDYSISLSLSFSRSTPFYRWTLTSAACGVGTSPDPGEVTAWEAAFDEPPA